MLLIIGELETTLSLKQERLLKSEQEACELKESLDVTKQQLSQYLSQLDQTQGMLEANEVGTLRCQACWCEQVFISIAAGIFCEGITTGKRRFERDRKMEGFAEG